MTTNYSHLDGLLLEESDNSIINGQGATNYDQGGTNYGQSATNYGAAAPLIWNNGKNDIVVIILYIYLL